MERHHIRRPTLSVDMSFNRLPITIPAARETTTVVTAMSAETTVCRSFVISQNVIDAVHTF